MKTVGIIGYGFVGKAVSQLRTDCEVEIYDPFIKEYKNNLKAFKQDFVFVCVPTPTMQDGSGKVDLRIVNKVALQWSTLSNESSILVIKSTIPTGTVKTLKNDLKCDRIVHNPEFLTQRTNMKDFRNPNEIIVGGEEIYANEVLSLYDSYHRSSSDIQFCLTSAEMAEMIKTVRNSFYATKVTFFNEVHDLCTATGLDYPEFRDLFTSKGKHPWVAEQHTSVPGPDGQYGFGGICLPKDSEGLLARAKSHGVEMKVLEAAIASNKGRRNETK